MYRFYRVVLYLTAAACIAAGVMFPSLSQAFPPKAGQYMVPKYTCTVDAGGRLLKVLHDKAQVQKRFTRFMGMGECKAVPPKYWEIISVLASKKDYDGDLVHMVDLGQDRVTFVLDNKLPTPKSPKKAA